MAFDTLCMCPEINKCKCRGNFPFNPICQKQNIFEHLGFGTLLKGTLAVLGSLGVFKYIYIFLQDNKISFWSIGSHEASANEDEFEGDPQLLCDQKHNGDVLDLQVRPLWQSAVAMHQHAIVSRPLAQKYNLDRHQIIGYTVVLIVCRCQLGLCN